MADESKSQSWEPQERARYRPFREDTIAQVEAAKEKEKKTQPPPPPEGWRGNAIAASKENK